MASVADQKAALRATMIARRDTLTERDQRSRHICARAQALPEVIAAPALHCYLPIRSEVDTRPLIAAALAVGKAVAVPIVVGPRQLAHSWITSLDETEWVRGAFGTWQPRRIRPAFPGEWSVTIVPLLAFDRALYRLGYGGGFYDAFLSSVTTTAIGLAFAAQAVAHLPRESHDRPLDIVVCEDAVYRSAAIQPLD